MIAPSATTAHQTRRVTVRIEDCKPLRSNTLRGFIDIIVPKMRLRIIDATVHESSQDKRWVGLPAKPQITRDGQVRRDERGKVQCAVLQFIDRTTGDAFSACVVAALLEDFPNAFDDEVAA